jgi:hypothetical protein
MPYTVQILKNGRVYGTLGPYAQRADALADAAVLKRPGLSVSVVGAAAPTRANNPAAAAATRVAVSFLLPLLTGMVKGKIQEFLSLDRPGQIELLRKLARGSPPVRMALSSDTVADAVADSLVLALAEGRGEALVDTAALAVSKNPRRRNFRRTH